MAKRLLCGSKRRLSSRMVASSCSTNPQHYKLRDSPDFTVHNLPYGVFSSPSSNQEKRIGVAIGDHILDCKALVNAGILPEASGMAEPNLNTFMSRGKTVWESVRASLKKVASARIADSNSEYSEFAVDRSQVQLHMPCTVTDYTDFFTAPQHASRGHSESLRGGNWMSMPIGYSGRTSSLRVADGLDGLKNGVRRPRGQYVDEVTGQVLFGPSKWLDYELEVGAFVGGAPAETEATASGALSNSVEQAESRLFGLVLLNDWSARDIQRFEMSPLGPFLGKSFATTISPWVVPMLALEEFRLPGCENGGPNQDSSRVEVPKHLRYSSKDPSLKQLRNIGMHLSADLVTMDNHSFPMCRTNLECIYWSFAQMVAHHQSNGCLLEPGDLLGSGTLSSWTGPFDPSRSRGGYPLEQALNWGCLAEQNLYGRTPIPFRSAADGEEVLERVWLEDGDSVVLSGFAEKGEVRVGFGQSRCTVLPVAEYHF